MSYKLLKEDGDVLLKEEEGTQLGRGTKDNNPAPSNKSDMNAFFHHVLSLPAPYSPLTPEWYGYIDAYYYKFPPSQALGQDENKGSAYFEGYMTGLIS